MSFGKFNEATENNETNEARETTDNVEKPRNQILEMPEDEYSDDFESKLDSNEANDSGEGDTDGDMDSNLERGNEEKGSLLDRMKDSMKSIFSKKESAENDKTENAQETSEPTNPRNSFVENLRKDAPSYKEQADMASKFEGKDKDEYLDQRGKSERAYEENPNKKSWELSSEQMADVKKDAFERE